MNTKKNLLLILSVLVGSTLILPAQSFRDSEGEGRPPHKGSEGPRGDRPPSKEDMMKRFDKDGDGKLSKEEREAADEAMEAEIIKRASEHFDEIDKDGNGSLSREEFIAGVRKQMRERRDEMKERNERGREMMEQFDKDGDGKLSKEEREALREHMQSNRPNR